MADKPMTDEEFYQAVMGASTATNQPPLPPLPMELGSGGLGGGVEMPSSNTGSSGSPMTDEEFYLAVTGAPPPQGEPFANPELEVPRGGFQTFREDVLEPLNRQGLKSIPQTFGLAYDAANAVARMAPVAAAGAINPKWGGKAYEALKPDDWFAGTKATGKAFDDVFVGQDAPLQIFDEPRKSESRGAAFAGDIVGGGLTGAGILRGLGSKIGGRLGRIADRNVPSEVAGSLGGGLTGGAAYEFAPEGAKEIVGLTGGVVGGAGAAKFARGTTLAGSAATRGKDALQSPTTTELTASVKEKLGRKVEVEAVDRLSKAMGGEDKLAELIQRLDQLPEGEFARVSSVAEQLFDPSLPQDRIPFLVAGLERYLVENAADVAIPVLRDRRMAAEAAFEQGARGLGRADPETVAAGAQGSYNRARNSVVEAYRAVDPEDTIRVGITGARSRLKKTLSTDFRSGTPKSSALRDFLRGKDPTADKGQASWAWLQDVRARAVDERDRAFASGAQREGRVSSALVKEIDRVMEGQTSNMTAVQAKAFQEAKQKRIQLDKDFSRLESRKLVGLKQKDPSQMAKTVLSGTPEAAKDLAKQLSPAEGRALVGTAVDGWLSRTTKTGDINWNSLQGNWINNRKKLEPFMSPAHKKRADDVMTAIARSNRATKEGREAVRVIDKKGVKSLLDNLKDIMASRLGWTYPIEKKVIQMGAHKLKLNQASFSELVDLTLVQMLNDPQVMRAVTTSRRKGIENADWYKSALSEVEKQIGGYLADATIAKVAVVGSQSRVLIDQEE